jgi:rRNA biogenesis protein RRP5
MGFPRGGQKELSALEYRDITDKAKKDLLFHDEEDEVESKKRGAEEEEAQGPNKKKTNNNIPMLGFGKIRPEMTLCGVICSVNELDIAIALGNGLVGYCSITEISLPITRLVEAVAEGQSEEDVPFFLLTYVAS